MGRIALEYKEGRRFSGDTMKALTSGQGHAKALNSMFDTLLMPMDQEEEEEEEQQEEEDKPREDENDDNEKTTEPLSAANNLILQIRALIPQA